MCWRGCRRTSGCPPWWPSGASARCSVRPPWKPCAVPWSTRGPSLPSLRRPQHSPTASPRPVPGAAPELARPLTRCSGSCCAAGDAHAAHLRSDASRVCAPALLLGFGAAQAPPAPSAAAAVDADPPSPLQEGLTGQPSTSYPQPAPYDHMQSGPYVSQPDPAHAQQYPQQQAQAMYPGHSGPMGPQGGALAPSAWLIHEVQMWLSGKALAGASCLLRRQGRPSAAPCPRGPDILAACCILGQHCTPPGCPIIKHELNLLAPHFPGALQPRAGTPSTQHACIPPPPLATSNACQRRCRPPRGCAGTQYAPPDPGGYAAPQQQQYGQAYAPYGQPGLAPPPYYAPPQYAPQGPPGYAQVSLPMCNAGAKRQNGDGPTG